MKLIFLNQDNPHMIQTTSYFSRVEGELKEEVRDTLVKMGHPEDVDFEARIEVRVFKKLK